MKSIHERVRASIEKREKLARAKIDNAHNARMGRLVTAGMRRERRIDALIAGDLEPRNAAERAIVDRALGLDF